MQSQCKADVAGPKRIPSSANDQLSAAILDDGRHRELACGVEPNRIVCAAVELEECIAIPARALAQVRALGKGGPAAHVNRPASDRSASNSGVAKRAPANVVTIPGAP